MIRGPSRRLIKEAYALMTRDVHAPQVIRPSVSYHSRSQLRMNRQPGRPARCNRGGPLTRAQPHMEGRHRPAFKWDASKGRSSGSPTSSLFTPVTVVLLLRSVEGGNG